MLTLKRKEIANVGIETVEKASGWPGQAWTSPAMTWERILCRVRQSVGRPV
jgi:hypothetical protein